jgi:pimeloyl-ACP methyl ester carboxylesterase
LMITAAWDPVLAPALASGMPSLIDDLEMHEIPRCGHWTQQEHPDEVNRLLVDWLRRRVA